MRGEVDVIDGPRCRIYVHDLRELAYTDHDTTDHERERELRIALQDALVALWLVRSGQAIQHNVSAEPEPAR